MLEHTGALPSGSERPLVPFSLQQSSVGMEQLCWELWEWLLCWDALRIPLLSAEP